MSTRVRNQIVRQGIAVNQGWLGLLRQAGWTVARTDVRNDGWQSWGKTGDGRSFSLIISQATELDGNDWVHVSLYVGDDALPTYPDLATLHRAIFGRRRYAYQVFAPAGEHINIKEVLHLWGRADGQPGLPDFTHGGQTI